MSHNLEYLLTRPGGLKLATVIFGVVSAILSCHSYANSPYSEYYSEELARNNTRRLPGTELELSNMSTTLVFLGISVVYLLAHSLFYIICESRLNKFIDTSLHMAGALLLFAGGATLFYNAFNIKNNGCNAFETFQTAPRDSIHSFLFGFIPSVLAYGNDVKLCQYFAEKIVAAAFNVVNSVLYALLAFVIFTTELEEL
ncbi:hypothetical protein Ocin01_07167 [Orchesella cincta]|uniref:MARVEL domain-containing protein n=1 Tax=Orchesella cincta TaxID=48709 RepID=A0A1D2N383_ORCCI|nr:hypothetical protein Ocin01_07167 [Orchesella cincta]